MTVVVLKEDFCCSAVFTLKRKSKSSETFFCNRQQHKYFVLLFVPFLYQKQKREKKKRKEVNVFNVFLVPLQSWFPN